MPNVITNFDALVKPWTRVEVWNHLGPEQVLHALNQNLTRLEGPLTREIDCLFGDDSFVGLPIAGFVSWDILVAFWLRPYVDRWLLSGIGEDLRESPHERRLTTNGRALIKRYLAEVPKVHFTNDESLVVTIGQERKTERSETALDSEEWRLRPSVAMVSERRRNRVLDAQLEAERLFATIILSDWKNQLCRCRQCGMYFIAPPRAKPVRYKNGAFCCRAHQQKSSAVRLTGQRRESVRSKLVGIAAQELRSKRWPDTWPGDRDRK